METLQEMNGQLSVGFLVTVCTLLQKHYVVVYKPDFVKYLD